MFVGGDLEFYQIGLQAGLTDILIHGHVVGVFK